MDHFVDRRTVLTGIASTFALSTGFGTVSGGNRTAVFAHGSQPGAAVADHGVVNPPI